MAQAAASSVNKNMEMSMERLSTGKRINGAADDAAGIAISSRLTSEVRGTNQAIRNAMDAQGLIDTAEGAHDEISNILQRMRELAVQSINDTNSTKDRAALQTEMDQLKTEIDRIAHSTSWAGDQLLNGVATSSVATSTTANKSLSFQVGSGTRSSDSVTLTIQALSADKLALSNTASTPTITVSESATATTYPAPTFAVKTGAAAAFALSAPTAAGVVTVTKNTTAHAAATASEVTIAIDGISTDFNFYTDGSQKGFDTSTAAGQAAAIAAKLNLNSSFADNGITIAHQAGAATFSVVKAGTATLTESGGKITVGATFDAGETFTLNIEGTAVSVTNATDGYSDDKTGMIQHMVDKINSAKIAGITAAVGSGADAGKVVVTKSSGLDISSATFEAKTATNKAAVLTQIDTALETLNSQRAKLGAYSNRLDNTVSNLTSMSNNLQAGRGRIEDADFAAETTSLAKSQILQQASTAMLAQANASKQNVLSLLQG
ncbi:MAG: flagellin [Rhodobacteraceae bacterium]|nr:flagellin [Paracoccaceae bacterium]